MLFNLSSFILRTLLVVVGLGASLIAQAELEKPSEYLQVFQSGSLIEQQEAAANLEWAGLRSPELFDLIEAKTLEALPRTGDKTTLFYVSHLVRALGYSGNEKYLPAIEKTINEAPHKRLKNHALSARSDVPRYKTWNPIIAPQTDENLYPSYEQRLSNLLKSGDNELVRMGAKRVVYSRNYAPELLAQINGQVEAVYLQPLDRLGLDTAAWLCRALASSRAPEYRATLEKVAADANDKKLRKYAQKYLKQY